MSGEAGEANPRAGAPRKELTCECFPGSVWNKNDVLSFTRPSCPSAALEVGARRQS